ncbi:MAG TPA: glycosyltransferase family 2 protein [Patescibacteria group bacterium]|nr:glycosyltransferase family 2 protein [Patescibacteria group bacterium]
MTISAVIIARNEEGMIANCLDTLRWCDEIIVVDHASSDGTPVLSERAGAKVIEQKKTVSLAELRNVGLVAVQSDWILYIDADERVTPALMKEIKSAVLQSNVTSFAVRRNNIHYGKWMRNGGWEKDSVVRLFKTSSLKKWSGEIHEHAEVEGKQSDLWEPLVHLSHRNLLDGLRKSMEWTPIEADLLAKANHPKMSMLRLIKVMVMEFIRRFFILKGWKDGFEGGIESMVQAVNRFFVYEQLWERQRIPTLEQTYDKIEQEIQSQWKRVSA